MHPVSKHLVDFVGLNYMHVSLGSKINLKATSSHPNRNKLLDLFLIIHVTSSKINN